MDRLKQMLDTINVNYTERIFETEDGIAGLRPEPYVSELIDTFISCPMIYVFSFYIPTGFQHQNTHNCNLLFTCKITAM